MLSPQQCSLGGAPTAALADGGYKQWSWTLPAHDGGDNFRFPAKSSNDTQLSQTSNDALFLSDEITCPSGTNHYSTRLRRDRTGFPDATVFSQSELTFCRGQAQSPSLSLSTGKYHIDVQGDNENTSAGTGLDYLNWSY